jgi:putative endonuclease
MGSRATTPANRDGPVHYVYVLRCADDTLYVGYAKDLQRRVAVHNRGKGARYTCGRRPVTLVHAESFDTVGEALRREREIKRWTRAKKDALIEGDLLASARPD